MSLQRKVSPTPAGLALAALVLAAAACQAPAVYEWAQPTFSVTVPDLTAMGQAQSGSVLLTLQHDGPASIQAAATTAGSEVLRSGGGDSLLTSYRLTGAALGASADADFIASSSFIAPTKTYTVQGVGPSELTLQVQARTAADRANAAAAYSGSVTLTLSW